jgi:hypothetical protein
MQRCRAGFLRAGENEIEPVDFAASPSKHDRNVTEILWEWLFYFANLLECNRVLASL